MIPIPIIYTGLLIALYQSIGTTFIAPLKSEFVALEAKQEAKEAKQEAMQLVKEAKQVAKEAAQEAKQDRLMDMLNSKFDIVFSAEKSSSELSNYLKGKVDVLEKRR